MRIGILLLAAFAFTTARSAAAEETDRSHWFRVRYQLVEETRGFDIDAETTAFRDGVVVTTNVNRGLLLNLRRGQATQPEMVTLRRSMVRNRIAEQAGDCNYPFLGGQNSTVRLTVTWFDGHGGSHRFAVGRAFSFETPCPQGTGQLVEDILRFVTASRGRGRREVEEVTPEPPFPFSPCEEP